MSDCDIWVDGDVVFGAFAAAGALFAYYLYITVTMGNGPLMGGRKRRNLGAYDILWLGKCTATQHLFL